MKEQNIYKDILFGVAIGDALGVPVEFKSREIISHNPVTDMVGFGTYNLPAGTFSDDSSLTFCLAESLTEKFSLESIAQKFVMWYRSNYWTPYGNVFDIGIATRQAILTFEKGCKPELAGGFEVSQNGNGSLMRILPLLDIIKDLPIEERYLLTKQVSSITHGHIRSVIACFYYLEFARQIVLGIEKSKIYKIVKTDVLDFIYRIGIVEREILIFERLLFADITKLTESEIKSSGYVLHTLEASIWCLLTTTDYSSAVLKAVNLGEDTDTTGAVTGGLAGLLYGYESIPKSWATQLARKEDISDLAERWKIFASS
ncbi:ADP-ribosylglycohydrolase family protein [Lacihabitans soyangensis]|uniref:ADP-ribosylglycohydrolase family protein n=1 Tax=Lacihabitans soyangensis TaxID=869394 RepID=A0AAE3H6N3_9BACT|nr:ADP-ribosylglycohydrolase family protein [Lacihabitans soyangensis]MCP9763980.1 ADP-ribosylglycohydrolase family protein [Lacihabitans soyangensis]